MGETRYENSPQPDRLSGFTCPAPVYLSLQQSTFRSDPTNYIHIRAHMPQLLQHHFVPHLCHTDAGQALHVVQRTSPSMHTTNQSCGGKKTEAQQGGHNKNPGGKKKKKKYNLYRTFWILSFSCKHMFLYITNHEWSLCLARAFSKSL